VLEAAAYRRRERQQILMKLVRKHDGFARQRAAQRGLAARFREVGERLEQRPADDLDVQRVAPA
jgi:hypothetical protein